jgi:hypothetical protein
MRPIRFLAERQPCRSCGEPCYTLRPGTRTRVPEHPLCARTTLEELDELEPHEALQTLAEAFGRLTVLPPPEPKPSELGPCGRCREMTRRYGPFGHAWCDRCRDDKKGQE